MLWKYDRQSGSLKKRLTYLYTLSTVGLLTVIALLFFPKLARIVSQFNDPTHVDLTIECIKTILLMLLFISIGAMVLGQILAKKGLIQLEKFSSDIAHELRHPLQHVMQMTELSLSRKTIDPSVQALLVNYMKEFQNIATLVEQLLFIARSEHGQIPLNKTAIDLRPFVESLFAYYQAWAEEKGIMLSCEGQGVLKGDAVLLQRALCNLLANALQHTPEGGGIMITLSTLKRRNRVCIELRDNGPGIESKHLPHLFQRFYQVDAARSQSGGLGLGLSIVQSIVTLHRGQIRIQSTPKVGTTVSLVFPS